MGNDVRAPVGISEAFLRDCVARGWSGLAHAALAEYFDAYRAYAGVSRGNDVDVGARLLDSRAVGLSAESGGLVASNCSASARGFGVCQVERIGGRCTEERRGGDTAGGSDEDGRRVAGVDDVGCDSSQLRFGVGFGVGRQSRKNRRKREKSKEKKATSLGDQSGSVNFAGVAASEQKVASAESGTVAGSGTGGGKAGYSFRDVTTDSEQRVFARQWFERRSVENELAIQRGRYNVKHNEYMLSSRIAEKKWECDRLRCEEKLDNINRIRFGSKPGYAETLASLSDGSEKPPSLSTGSDSPASLSDGTVSPNSSMSVAEECRLRKKLEEMSEENTQLKLERAALTTSRACSGGRVVVEDGQVHVYDGIGQYVPPTPVYGSECALSMGDYPEELQRYCGSVH